MQATPLMSGIPAVQFLQIFTRGGNQYLQQWFDAVGTEIL